jgi:hypothetical protein
MFDLSDPKSSGLRSATPTADAALPDSVRAGLTFTMETAIHVPIL